MRRPHPSRVEASTPKVDNTGGHDVVCGTHRTALGVSMRATSSAAMLAVSSPPPSSIPNSAPVLPGPVLPILPTPALSHERRELWASLVVASASAVSSPAIVLHRSGSCPAPAANIPVLVERAVHPFAVVVHPRLEPRFSRALTGVQLQERLLARRLRQTGQWRSKRAEREARSYRHDWDEMLSRGGNEYVAWPLRSLQAVYEKTVCGSWDGEDSMQRHGCQHLVKFVGISRIVHDHIRIKLQCTNAACGREVTLTNRDGEKRAYDLPSHIKQHSFSADVLKRSLFYLASGIRPTAMQRSCKLQDIASMAMSTYYAYQHVVWHFVHVAFEVEMTAQRKRQQGSMARYGC